MPQKPTNQREGANCNNLLICPQAEFETRQIRTMINGLSEIKYTFYIPKKYDFYNKKRTILFNSRNYSSYLGFI